jgi:hypothetical protein
VKTVSHDEERRYDRRREDVRLIELESAVRSLTTEISKSEGLVKANTVEIGRIRTALGDRLTTLIFDLDERYMPRTELMREFVPRTEHEANERNRRNWRRQWPALTVAALVLAVQVISLAHALH